MVNVKVLLENTKSDNRFKEKHGLSLFIECGVELILLDVGPDDKFLFNSRILNTDIPKIETLLLSHNHIDHTGGLDAFCVENTQANIYLFSKPSEKYYTKVMGFFNYPISLKCNQQTKKRITTLKDDFQINSHAWFIQNRVHTFNKSSLNSALYMQTPSGIKPDTFSHEGILVIEDNGELVLFNSCSHNGVINSIESVMIAFPKKRIRTYVGGFHFCNPVSKQHETDEALDEFGRYFINKDIQLYTGHCTGEYAFHYLKQKLGNKIHQISTGMELKL